MSMGGPTWGINPMYFPADDLLGARRYSNATGGAPPVSGSDVSPVHRYIVLGLLVVVGYVGWHYSMTH